MKIFQGFVGLWATLGLFSGTTAFAQTFSTPNFSNGQAARLVIGQSTFTESAQGAQDILIGSAAGVAVANGTLFVVDSNHFSAVPSNNRVLLFPMGTFPKPTDEVQNPPYTPSPDQYNCFVCVGKANVVLGQPDYNNNAVNLSQSGFRSPVGVTTDGVRLIVADTDNNRVLIWNSIPTSINQPADVVLGQPDFSHNNTASPPTAKTMRGPQGVWLAGGKLYVADTQDNRVLIFNSVPTTNGASPDLVIGQPNFTVQPPVVLTNMAATQSNLFSPVSVTTDGTRMYVSDLGSNRVLIWNKIPTSNGAPADVVIGQPDFTTSIANNTPSLCLTNGTDSTGAATYPNLCGRTLSFPRYALSDGTRLFIADGGNDRVLIYSTIPTTNGVPADIVLGQIDFTTDNPSDGASHMYTPTSMAWDGTNLYVADCFNRRILAYSPGLNLLPLSATRNAASLEVFATGTITLGGAITAKDTVTVTIAQNDINGGVVNTKDYAYTVQTNDALADVVNGLVSLINAKPGDPNVTAFANTANSTIYMTAKTGGQIGTTVTYLGAVSTNATETIAPTTATAMSINLADATQIAPGSLVTIFGVNLSDTSAVGQPDANGYYPFSLGGVEVYVDGIRTPLTAVSPTQLNAQMPYPVFDRTSSSLYVRTTHSDGTVTVTTPEGVSIVNANPGIFAAQGIDPRPGYVYHASKNATGVISVDGSITPGDVGTITIGSSPYATGSITLAGSVAAGDTVSITVTRVDSSSNIVNTATYTYTAIAGDTLVNVTNGLVALINSAPDPNVTAVGNPSTGVIQLSSIAYGASGTQVNYSAATTGSNVTATTGSAALVLTTKTYTYKVTITDTLIDIVNAFVSQINGDPNSLVTAQPSNVFTRILLTAKQSAAAGDAIPISVNVSTGTALILTALSSQTCCYSNGGQVTDDNPAQPGELVYIFATGLGVTTNNIPTGQIAGPDNTDQPVTPVDSILAGGSTANIVFTNYVPGQIGTFSVTFQLGASIPDNPQTELTIAQGFFVSNAVTFNVNSLATTTATARQPTSAAITKAPKPTLIPRPKTATVYDKAPSVKAPRPDKSLQRKF